MILCLTFVTVIFYTVYNTVQSIKHIVNLLAIIWSSEEDS